MPLAKIAATSPLTVLMPGASTAQPAKVLGTYAPTAGALVVVLLEPGQTYVLGAA